MIEIDKLTGEEIDSLTPSRELDIEILVRVYGWNRKRIYYPDWDTEKLEPMYIPSGKPLQTHRINLCLVPFFSSEISSALDASQRLARMNWQDNFGGSDLNGLTLSHTGGNGYAAAFMSECDFPEEWWEHTAEMYAASTGDTPAIAIIRALVKALVFVSKQGKS